MEKYEDYFNKLDKKMGREKALKTKKRKIRWMPILLIVFLMMFSASIGFIVPIAMKLALLDVFFTLAPAQNFITETNILILGVDSVQGTHRSDTIMVVHIDPAQKEAKLVSIPRDTLAMIPGHGLDKINHAFAFGGVALSRATVSKFLNIDIPYYVTINISGLADMIDSLGGITVDVEKRMYYVDYAGDLFVDLKPGLQRLTGSEAVGYVRFRHDNEGDAGRISRQQKFLRALANKFGDKSNILKSPRLIMSLLSDIQTNMNIKEILGLAMAVRQSYDLGRIEMASIPGKDIMIDKVYYWRPDYEATQDIMKRFFKADNERSETHLSTATAY